MMFRKWCRFHGKALIVTDKAQYDVALSIRADIDGVCDILPYDEIAVSAAKSLARDDLLVVALSSDTYMSAANRYFSPFSAPEGVISNYVFIRLDITRESLIQGLETPKSLVYDMIAELKSLAENARLRVVNGAGTDISLGIKSFTTCSHEVTETCRYAFLPPSETYADVLPGTASGKIVIDVTVGQLYYFGKLLGSFGIVDSPVTMFVENGYIVDISGGDMAAELRRKLFELPVECRELVELGHGLSQMQPTGLIGVDESIIDTCHFGIGDGKFGVHLDVVISNPAILS